MKKIQIKTKDFFELLKIKETSMWDIFTQMIDSEEKEIIFLDNDNNFLDFFNPYKKFTNYTGNFKKM